MTEEQKPQTISIWTEIPDDTAAAFPRLGKNATLQVIQVGPAAISENLKEFLTNFQKVLAEQTPSIEGYALEEIELSLVVNAAGGIELVGKASAGVQAGIKIKLKKTT